MVCTTWHISSAFSNTVFSSVLFFPLSLFFHSLTSLMFMLLFILVFAFLDSLVFDSGPWKPELVRGLFRQPCWFVLMVTSSPPALVGIVWMYSQNFLAHDLWSSWDIFFPCVSDCWQILIIPRNFWSQAFKSVGHVCPEMSSTSLHFFCECPGDVILFPCFSHSHFAIKSFFVDQNLLPRVTSWLLLLYDVLLEGLEFKWIILGGSTLSGLELFKCQTFTHL